MFSNWLLFMSHIANLQCHYGGVLCMRDCADCYLPDLPIKRACLLSIFEEKIHPAKNFHLKNHKFVHLVAIFLVTNQKILPTFLFIRGYSFIRQLRVVILVRLTAISTAKLLFMIKTTIYDK